MSSACSHVWENVGKYFGQGYFLKLTRRKMWNQKDWEREKRHVNSQRGEAQHSTGGERVEGEMVRAAGARGGMREERIQRMPPYRRKPVTSHTCAHHHIRQKNPSHLIAEVWSAIPDTDVLIILQTDDPLNPLASLDLAALSAQKRSRIARDGGASARPPGKPDVAWRSVHRLAE